MALTIRCIVMVDYLGTIFTIWQNSPVVIKWGTTVNGTERME